MEDSKDQVTWTSISRWTPLIVSAISIALTFATLDRRLALVEQKIDQLIVTTEKMTNKYSDVEDKYGTLAIRVNILETKIGK
jgi:hypothetical protein